jgi:hypothetical protein
MVRKLVWKNVNTLSNSNVNDYESVHWYMRPKNNLLTDDIPNVYKFNSIKINEICVIIDIFRSVKYNALVFLCNNRNYIQQKCKFDILSLSVKEFVVESINVDRTKKYVEVDDGYLPDRFHNEILVIKNFPEHISNINILLNNIIYPIKIKNANTQFVNSKVLSTIQKNEIHLIEPWIEWHKKIGFEYFFIYDNNFNIHSYNELFKKYPSELIVYNAEFPYWLESYGKSSVGQVIQQNHTLWKFSPKFLGLTDLDEYIYPLSKFNIFDEHKAVLSIPNYWFGCSDNKLFHKDILKSYIKRELRINKTSNRKCIINPLLVDLICVHIALNYDGIYLRAEHTDVYLRHYMCLSDKKRKCDCKLYCVVEDEIKF